jgi:predicted DNA-binding transcriptional regulator AlpA
MEVVMDDHGGAQMPFLGAERHTGERSRDVHRDRRGHSSVGGSGSRADRRLNPDRRAGGKGGRRGGEGVEAERLREDLTPPQLAARLQVTEKRVVQLLRNQIPGAGARAGASVSPRAAGREPRNRERKAVSVPGYISRAELCRRLGISRATSYRLERDGFLPRPVRIGPRTTRWPVSELEVYERRLAEDRGAANVHACEVMSGSAD